MRAWVLGAQNRIKTAACSKLSVPRLGLLMRSSLSYRKQVVDLTKRLDIFREASVILDDALTKGASNKTGTNVQDISFWAATIALYDSCIVCEIA